MKKKYKEVKNRPCPIPGLGMIGGRATFTVDDDTPREALPEINRLVGIGRLRLLETTETVIVEEKPEVEEKPNPEPSSEPGPEPETDEKTDESLTNDEEMVELDNDDDSAVSDDKPKKKKSSKRKKKRGKSEARKS